MIPTTPCTIAWCDKSCTWEAERPTPDSPVNRIHKREGNIWDATLLETYSNGEHVINHPVFEIAYGIEIAGLEMAGQAAADLFLLARTVQEGGTR